jgi:myo-inositol catabolism protein IolC
MALDLVTIILKRMRIAVGWDRILIPSNHIILVTGKDKNWDSLAITVITHRISFTDDDASRNSADQGNIASQKDTRMAS